MEDSGDVIEGRCMRGDDGTLYFNEDIEKLWKGLLSITMKKMNGIKSWMQILWRDKLSE